MKFFDTCSLLLAQENILNENHFLISSVSLQELENIKTSAHKDLELKYQARKLLNLLAENPSLYTVIIFKKDFENYITEANLEITNDTKIIACAQAVKKDHQVIFITNDLSAYMICKNIFQIDTEQYEFEKEKYVGYLEIIPTYEELQDFYLNDTNNIFNLNINQYLIIKDINTNKIIEVRKWTGNCHKRINQSLSFTSNWFGTINAKDIYQDLAMDSLLNNQITLLKGKAGSGKTLLSLSYLIQQLESQKLDKIIVFCNTVATKNSARLGFYPGTKDEKLLDSQIGNLLASKLGGKYEVEKLIQEEKILLLPLSDIRGFDTNGMKAGVYISEAQNLDINLMKLALQRIGADCCCIIDGDDECQVDLDTFANENNGMKRVSKIFRNNFIYGEVQLQNIYRSKIAQLAEKL